MRRTTVSGVVALAICVLAVQGATAGPVVLLNSPRDSSATPSCPGTATLRCTVVSRTTAYQVVVGSTYQPMKVRVAGRIVGWKITLSSPTAAQTHFFDVTEGGTAQAAIAVIHQVKGLDYRLEAIGPITHLEPYFGHNVTFPLTTTIPVAPGDLIALSVPTWAPALELNAESTTAWRASRPATGCKAVATSTVQLSPSSTVEYACIYTTALVHFAAIEIPNPVSAKPTK